MSNRNSFLPFFFILFMLSGFSGLIYESIWSHYLKLFLGHSSYAQILVLGIFMGGMAIGSALAAKLSVKLTNLILFYAIIEGIIGIFGISFHNIFVSVQSTAFESIFPLLGEPWLIHLVKWTLASLLIVPQSMLLGATFPLLSAGIIRRFPGNSGQTLAMLYFLNCLGAAIGILCNAFWLIPAIGLPGAILTAGIINIMIAITVYFLSKHDHFPAIKTVAQNTIKSNLDIQENRFHLFYLVAGLTGLASFMYEIGWIRMLTMVLGGSTHSFEIMLSAFILGLAIGGFWIRKKIQKFSNPLQALGVIQLAMGALAVLTIPLYNQTYELMGFAINALNKNESGYLLYTLFSYFISLVVMLPATICAGTTLPLITFVILKKSADDSVIGKVYAWNTFGSILGVVVAVQFVMPLFGLKWVIVGGALVDVLIGLYIISCSSSFKTSKPIIVSVCLCLAVFTLLPFTALDTKKMASGVFRYGSNGLGGSYDVIFHRDGKTSTVAITAYANGTRMILNNGKPDAGLKIYNDVIMDQTITPDTPTMVLLGALPYVYKPKPKLIANIGLGSGLTAHTILHHNSLVRLDTIEIEPAVIDAAQLFRPNVDKVFTDKRSNIIIDDAKTYFAASGNKYDVIVSEPPNPWVSGVAGLFSYEFYQQINRYLDDDSVFIQWIHLYEISPKLIATVYNALKPNFQDIHLYQISDSDVAFVASRSQLIPNYENLFQQIDMKTELIGIGIRTAEDIAIRQLAGKAILDAIFAVIEDKANSDYFPILDLGANKTRFLESNALSLILLYETRLLEQILQVEFNFFKDITLPKFGGAGFYAHTRANKFYTIYIERLNSKSSFFPADTNEKTLAKKLVELLNKCTAGDDESIRILSDSTIFAINYNVFNFLQLHELKKLFTDVKQCEALFSDQGKLFIDAHLAWLANDFSGLFKITNEYLGSESSITTTQSIQMLKLNLVSRVMSGVKKGGQSLWNKAPNSTWKDNLELVAIFNLLSRL